jgi:protein-S-isoprenylcysteine O-methyltransferase Ste14
MSPYAGVVFVAGSVPIAWLSRRSLLLLAWGVLLKSVSLGTLLLAGVATAALAAAARAEEAENVARFGQRYLDYMKRTRRFLPFVL